MIEQALGLSSASEQMADYSAAVSAEHWDDPLGWAGAMFPWGSGDLHGEHIREWQASILWEIGEAIKAGHRKICVDVSSGHGIGKSALIAMIGLWLVCTRHTRGVITANTKDQLQTKTMPEFKRWAHACLASEWLDISDLTVKRKVDKVDDWRIDALTWSKERPDAFGGLHNKKGALFLVFDEASGIPGIIWETIDGAMSDRSRLIIWLRFGNPLRNVGRFAELFRRAPSNAYYTIRRMIDSRTVEGVDVEYINAVIQENGGEDSDYAKSRWRGVFPSQSDWQLISTADVDEAMRRPSPKVLLSSPILMGIDFSRAGKDKTVVRLRRGMDAKGFRSYRWGHDVARNSMRLASLISTIIVAEQPHHVFADNGGIGGPIIDRLEQLGHRIVRVDAGSPSDDKTRWFNRRAQMWCRMAEAIKNGGLALEVDPTLRSNLIQQEFEFVRDTQSIKLISKEEMREDGLPSPDEAEGLVQTFAFDVPPLHDPRKEAAGNPVYRRQGASEYDPFEHL